MKASFNPFHLVAGMAADVSEEIADLEHELTAQNVDRVRFLYRHIDSLLTGINYAIGYTLEKEVRDDLEDAVKDLRDRLEAYRIDAMQLSWSDRLGDVVKIRGHVDVNGVTHCTAEIIGKTTLHAHSLVELAEALRQYHKEVAA